MAKYSKAIAAAVFALAAFLKAFYGVEIGGETIDQIVNGIIAVGTVWSVYAVRNKPV